MNSQKLKFGDKEVDKKEFYSFNRFHGFCRLKQNCSFK